VYFLKTPTQKSLEKKPEKVHHSVLYKLSIFGYKVQYSVLYNLYSPLKSSGQLPTCARACFFRFKSQQQKPNPNLTNPTDHLNFIKGTGYWELKKGNWKAMRDEN
jgi:hypothetical protein